ncbi:MAG: hypothetical protein ABGY41_09500, partial [Candidatus Poribacteria bacterium]
AALPTHLQTHCVDPNRLHTDDLPVRADPWARAGQVVAHRRGVRQICGHNPRAGDVMSHSPRG